MGSRKTDHRAEDVYTAAKAWVDCALRNDGSLFTPGAPIWSGRLLGELRERFEGHGSARGNFYVWLKPRLAGSPAEVYQLMGELLYLFFLITHDPSTKHQQIETVLGWSPSPVHILPERITGLEPGLINGGRGFFSARPSYVAFLIAFAEQWKQQELIERTTLLHDPWGFSDFVQSLKLPGAPAQREALLHLIFPDTFEAIVSMTHKRRIADTFADRITQLTSDVNHKLVQIRKSFEAELGRDFSFYERDIREQWDSSRPAPTNDKNEPEKQLNQPEVQQYTVANIEADGCFIHRSRLETMLNRLRTKKNLILQGPPGTGKTWLAKKLAFALIGSTDESKVRRFQFHPNMSYEDFIRGFRPQQGGLNLIDGPFLEVVSAAVIDQAKDYVIVIEEINRGNPAQIFGEMLTLLEADKHDAAEALELTYKKFADERIYIPPNLYVIGTMNVADRSIALVDLALRRRFAFIDLEPTFGDVWRRWVHDQSGVSLDFLRTIEQRLIDLNRQIADDRSLGPQFRVGHSYVTPTPGRRIENSAEWFTQVVETDIGPLLEEYWFDDSSKAREATIQLLRDL